MRALVLVLLVSIWVLCGSHVHCVYVSVSDRVLLRPSAIASSSLLSRSAVRQSKSLRALRMMRIRGGDRVSNSLDEHEEQEDGDDDNDEEEESDEDSDARDDSDAMSLSNWALSNNVVMRTIKETAARTPPLTRLYLALSISITVLSYFLNGNHWPAALSLDLVPTLFKLQLWRLFTGFLYMGQLDLFYPLTVQFVWQHMSQLEKLSSKEPAHFVTMLAFGAVALIAIYSLTGIPMLFLGHNLATYLLYIWSREFEGLDVNFMDVLTLKSETLPWFFCLQSLLLEQELPIADLIGILVGHLYWYCKQSQRLTPPSGLIEFFRRPKIADMYKPFLADQ